MIPTEYEIEEAFKHHEYEVTDAPQYDQKDYNQRKVDFTGGYWAGHRAALAKLDYRSMECVIERGCTMKEPIDLCLLEEKTRKLNAKIRALPEHVDLISKGASINVTVKALDCIWRRKHKDDE